MQIQFIKCGLRFFLRLSLDVKKVEIVRGVNSNIDPQTHFLMWDFDNVPLDVVKLGLMHTQDLFQLPDITIMKTKEEGYHAYCFKACSFVEARTIIAATSNVDKHFLMAGIGREYFTLRFSDIKDRTIKHECILPGLTISDLSYSDVNSFVEYSKANR
jgi:hypothetical protein